MLFATTGTRSAHPRMGEGSVSYVRRILLSPSWLARHALALFLIGLFIRMGIWQWTKGESDQGSIQNLFYGVEWPVFAAFVLYWWWRMIAEDLRPKDQTGPQWGKNGRIAPEAAPPSTTTDSAAAGANTAVSVVSAAEEETEEDRELAEYNRYLASLYERDAAASGRDSQGASR